MTVPDQLPDDITALKAIIRTQQDQNARLEALVKAFRKALFGSKSERVDPDQYELSLEDIETGIAQVEAEVDSDERTAPVREPKARKSRGALPKHLPRVEEIIEPDSTVCSCGHQRHVISEDVSEPLDIVPTQFRVILTRRPRYACRKCEGSFVQAPAVPRLIEGGMPTEATVATVLVSKFADHQPLFRQSQIYARQGVEIERATLASWVGKAAHELVPVYDALLRHLKTSTKLFMDETPAPVLDPGRGKVKKGYFWALARDDRAWSGPEPPGVAFTYAPGRSGKHASQILLGFTGILQVDGYAGYNRVLDPRDNAPIQLAYCWAHARRKLFELTQNNVAPIAQTDLKQIAALYRIETKARGLTADERLALRRDKSAPKIAAFKEWLDASRAQVATKSPTGEALKYIAKYWDGLILFLTDGGIEMDSNAVERTIRPIALQRKTRSSQGTMLGPKTGPSSPRSLKPAN